MSWVNSNVTVQDNTQQNSLEWSIIVGGLVKIFIFKSFCAIKSRKETSCYSLNDMLPGACYPDVAENLTRAFERQPLAWQANLLMCLELLIDWLIDCVRSFDFSFPPHLDSFWKNISAIVGGENICFRLFSFLFPIHLYVQTVLFPKFWYFLDSIQCTI